jgi:hypothetical protein
MKTQLMCPCGEYIHANNEEDLVALAQRHLETNHPDREYSRDEILFLSY